MRLVLAVVLSILASAPFAAVDDGPIPSPYAIEIPAWFTETLLDFREDVADAKRDGKRVLLYFGQDGCPYCAQLMKVNFSQPDIVATTRKHFVAIPLNIWGDREVTWTDGRTGRSQPALTRDGAIIVYSADPATSGGQQQLFIGARARSRPISRTSDTSRRSSDALPASSRMRARSGSSRRSTGSRSRRA